MSTACLDLVGLFDESRRRPHSDHVNQLEHALQCAAQARRDRADDEVVVAALLHDLGHLLTPDQIEVPGRHHGIAAAAALRPYVPPRVAWLIEHHVVAKRYLVTVDPRYAAALSPVSRRSLVAQGAGLAPEEASVLEMHPWFGDAVRLRRWDDAAKQPGLACDPLIEYRPLLECWLGAQRWTAGKGIDR